MHPLLEVSPVVVSLEEVCGLCFVLKNWLSRFLSRTCFVQIFKTHSNTDKAVYSVASSSFNGIQSLDSISFNKPTLGLIAGNGQFPFEYIRSANKAGHPIIAVCHTGETDPQIDRIAHSVVWIKVGELGKLIDTFVTNGVKQVAMAGGINRVRLFGGVKLDVRGLKLLAKIKSTKDDLIMRGIAEELKSEGIEVIESTRFLQESIATEGVMTRSCPSHSEREDITIGVDAIKAMSSQHIGQLVVIRDGVIVAVEAVEGTDAAILRGGSLGGAGTVVVKFAKTTQDMRFDVPTIGAKTIETMASVKGRVLAIEAGRTLIMDKEKTINLADKYGISIVGCEPAILNVKQLTL